MVFSINTIKESLNKPFPKNENIVGSFNEDISFFINSLEYTMMENREINIMLSQTYSSNELIKESIGSTLFKDILSKIDPKKIIIKIIESFMNLLDKLWNEFKAVMLNLVNKDIVIHKYKSDLMKIDKSFYYPETCYKYTNLGTNTSRTSFKYNLDIEFSNMCIGLNDIKHSSTYAEVSSRLKELRVMYNDQQSYFDDCRSKIVNKHEPVSRDKFSIELFNFYRNDGIIYEGIDIDPVWLKNIIDDYFNHSKNMKVVERDIKLLKEASKNILKEVKHLKLENYVKENITEEIKQSFLFVLKNFTIRIEQLAEIYSMTLSAKMDAVKENYKQASGILLYACKLHVKEEI